MCGSSHMDTIAAWEAVAARKRDTILYAGHQCSTLQLPAVHEKRQLQRNEHLQGSTVCKKKEDEKKEEVRRKHVSRGEEEEEKKREGEERREGEGEEDELEMKKKKEEEETEKKRKRRKKDTQRKIIAKHLHTPMYAFLQSLSLLDICYSSKIPPRALVDFWAWGHTVSFGRYATQFFFLSLFGTTEAFLLAPMAYNCFIAICSPLHYPVNNFFCNVVPILSLSCSNTFINQLVLLDLRSSIIVCTFLITQVSYIDIISAILKIRTVQGCHKAFSTCAFHLTGVCLFFGTIFFMYAKPSAASSMEQSKVVPVFHAVVIPMLNPLIYSLRNTDVQHALSRAKHRLSWQ
ncbi:Olfactory receptor 12 [Heterocephalus glaber]|uniref:Olfactory receptor 12 n=1 Tax=Heterocephalus glaber TaxID=10181 RepID=G5ASY3_HETGA|nr:Olfactory receptor 12 [Heterocephalus glaber]